MPKSKMYGNCQLQINNFSRKRLLWVSGICICSEIKLQPNTCHNWLYSYINQVQHITCKSIFILIWISCKQSSLPRGYLAPVWPQAEVKRRRAVAYLIEYHKCFHNLKFAKNAPNNFCYHWTILYNTWITQLSSTDFNTIQLCMAWSDVTI